MLVSLRSLQDGGFRCSLIRRSVGASGAHLPLGLVIRRRAHAGRLGCQSLGAGKGRSRAPAPNRSRVRRHQPHPGRPPTGHRPHPDPTAQGPPCSDTTLALCPGPTRDLGRVRGLGAGPQAPPACPVLLPCPPPPLTCPQSPGHGASGPGPASRWPRDVAPCIVRLAGGQSLQEPARARAGAPGGRPEGIGRGGGRSTSPQLTPAVAHFSTTESDTQRGSVTARGHTGSSGTKDQAQRSMCKCGCGGWAVPRVRAPLRAHGVTCALWPPAGGLEGPGVQPG